jgi:hypothetical protein
MSNPDAVAKYIDRTALSKSLGEIVPYDQGYIVNVGAQYPNKAPVFVGIRMSNGKLRITDGREGIRQIANIKPNLPRRPGYYLCKAAKMHEVRCDEGEVYALLPKGASTKDVIDAIRAVGSASQNGVLLDRR